ncbi:hypothetical protein [Acidovorax sp. FG27]|uniref:hypothetical protein n=1 Tax=Acidovorax sp. FG27 TaxID=3133652 RepID=UPI0030E9BB5E
MINRGILTGLAVAVGAMAIGAALWMRTAAPTAVDSAAPAMPSAPVTVGPGGVSQGAGLPQTVPQAPQAPWLAAPGGPGMAQTPASPAAPGGQAGSATLQDIQARAQALSTNKQPSAREVDALLSDLQKSQGNNVVAGVNLQVLRNNLAAADRMQQLAKEMQVLAATPGPAAAQEIQTRLAEIQRLQAQLSANVTAPAGAAR